MSNHTDVPIGRSATKVELLVHRLGMIWQRILDRLVPHRTVRWVMFALLMVLYMVRVYTLAGFYIVTYGLGIYLLNLVLVFLSPLSDPEDEDGGNTLPTSDEFKPFIRRMPEFKCWTLGSKAVLIALCMTLSDVFDIPVFWPILLFYFILLFSLTMKRRIQHMMQHRYVPWTTGKKTYVAKSDK
eukprot:PhM_4_TR17485/c0_g1_i1/m.96833